jgi:hypothetical protein
MFSVSLIARIHQNHDRNLQIEFAMKRAANCGLTASLFGLMAAGMTVGQAQTDSLVVAQFDADTTATFANLAWGTAIPSIIWDGAVNHVTPLGAERSGRAERASCRRRFTGRHGAAGKFEDRDGLLAGDALELVQKLVEAKSGFQVLE